MSSKTNEPLFNVAHINLCTEAEGPFKRVAIWFQGCDVGCSGCCNPELIPFVRKNIISGNDLITLIEQSRTENGIEGVTFLGGEPTRQQGLETLAEMLKLRDIGTILFTGHLLSEFSVTYLNHFDTIIDGPFDKTKPDVNRRLIGSTNQQITHMSKRYASQESWFHRPGDDVCEVNATRESIVMHGFWEDD